MRLNRIMFLAGCTMTIASASASGSAHADDAQGWIIWDRELNMTHGRLLTIGASGVQIEDRDGVRHSIARHRLAAIVETSDQNWNITPGSLADLRIGSGVPVALELTDGQRWMGQWIDPDGEADETLRVRLVRAGTVEVPLDLIARLAFRERSTHRQPTVSDVDVVHLVNGDRLHGTVLGIGKHVEIASDSGVLNILYNSVAAIEFANPASQAPEMRVWMSGARVFGAETITGVGLSDVSIEAVGPMWGHDAPTTIGPIRLWEPERDSVVVGIEFFPGRMAAWSTLETISVSPESGRRWTRQAELVGPNRLGSQALLFSGPMAVTWRLPGRGERASGILTLGQHAGEWTDCMVQIECGGQIRWEARLRPQEPTAAFSIDLRGERDVTVRVVSGAFGPIQNEVELRWGWVLVQPSDESDGRARPRR